MFGGLETNFWPLHFREVFGNSSVWNDGIHTASGFGPAKGRITFKIHLFIQYIYLSLYLFNCVLYCILYYLLHCIKPTTFYILVAINE